MTVSKQVPQFAKIVVTFESRADGGLRAYSDDVPGFVLSHRDASAVLRDVAPALERILSAMWGVAVRADKLTPIGEDGDDHTSPVIAAHQQRREYVAHVQ